MPLVIELWTSCGLVGGVEQWWDYLEHEVNERDPGHIEFPLLATVDPYADAVIAHADLAALRDELTRLAATARPTVAQMCAKLIALCTAALDDPAGELRLWGD